MRDGVHSGASKGLACQGDPVDNKNEWWQVAHPINTILKGDTDKLRNDKRLPVWNESPDGGVMSARERGSMFPHNLLAER